MLSSLVRSWLHLHAFLFARSVLGKDLLLDFRAWGPQMAFHARLDVCAELFIVGCQSLGWVCDPVWVKWELLIPHLLNCLCRRGPASLRYFSKAPVQEGCLHKLNLPGACTLWVVCVFMHIRAKKNGILAKRHLWLCLGADWIGQP